MRTASMVLGIVGGVLALIFAIVAFTSAAAMNVMTDPFSNYSDDLNDALQQYSDEFGSDFNIDGYDFGSGVAGVANGFATYMYVAGALAIVGGALGIVGGAIAKKKNVLAGIFMIIACVLAGFSLWGLFASVVLLVGGILALVKEKTPQAVPAGGYPYPPYQQPPQYNPYQQQPPQYNPYQQAPPQAPPQYNPYQQQAPQAPPQPPQYNPYQQAPPQAPSEAPEAPQEPKE